MQKRTVFKMLNEASVTYKDNSYLSQKNDSGWDRITFSEAKERALKLASAFIELGVNAKDKVAILSEAKIDWVISEFATLYASSVIVPLSIKLLPEEVPFRVNHSGAKFFVISENTLEKVIGSWNLYENLDLKIIVLDKPSAKISEICKAANFDEKQLLFIDDLYELGVLKLEVNLKKIEENENNTQENDVVTISYTSGTTGNPKGIMLTHLNYFSNSNEAVNTFKIGELISTLIILPTDHSFAHTIGLYTALVCGISIHFVDARGGGMNALKNIPINLVEAKPNFLLTVPALTGNFINKIKDGIKSKGPFIEGIFRRGLKAGILRNGDGFTKPGTMTQMATYFNYMIAEKLIFKKLRLIFGSEIEFFVGGGALLDIKQQQFYKAIGIPVYQGYGLTEASPIISTNTPFAHKMGTSGIILNNMLCKICDENGLELPKGQRGEICIKGDNVMKGYYKNEEATKETIKEGWLFTGDLGFIDKDNFLVVVGREKALLISEDGEKYSPEEIEEAIINVSPLIEQIMIYNDHKKYTTALITLNNMHVQSFIKAHKKVDADQLLQKLKKELLAFSKQPEFKGKFPSKWIPSNFQVIEEEFSEANAMINSTLKMVRHKITATYHDRLELLYGKDSQNTAAEKNKEVISQMFPIN